MRLAQGHLRGGSRFPSLVQPCTVGRGLQLQPEKSVRAQRDVVRRLCDGRKLDIAQHLDRRHPVEFAQVQRNRLRKPAQVGNTQDAGICVLAHIGQHLAVVRMEKAQGSAAEYLEQLAQRNHVAHPAQQARRVGLLRFDVDRFITQDRVHDDRGKQLGGVGAGEPGIAVARPLHGRTDAVAVAEIDVVAHPNLIAIVENRRAGERKQERIQQLDTAAVIVEQRSQTPPDPDVDAHPRVGGVREVHVIPLLVRNHFKRELVVVAQEDAPLARLRNRRGLRHDVGDG